MTIIDLAKLIAVGIPASMALYCFWKYATHRPPIGVTQGLLDEFAWLGTGIIATLCGIIVALIVLYVL